MITDLLDLCYAVLGLGLALSPVWAGIWWFGRERPRQRRATQRADERRAHIERLEREQRSQD